MKVSRTVRSGGKPGDNLFSRGYLSLSKRKDAWVTYLAVTIAENYCCTAFVSRGYREKTSHVFLVGFEDDLRLCGEIFRYAYESIKSGSKNLSSEEDRNGYGYGFCVGVKTAFERQNGRDQRYAMVLSVPVEVTDSVRDMNKVSYRSSAGMTMSAYSDGFSEGVKFSPNRIIPESQ